MRVADGAGCSGDHAGRAPQPSLIGFSRPQQLHVGADWGAQYGYYVFAVWSDRDYFYYNCGESHTFYISLNQVWTDGWGQ